MGDVFRGFRKQIKESCDGFVEGRTMTDEQLAHQAVRATAMPMPMPVLLVMVVVMLDVVVMMAKCGVHVN